MTAKEKIALLITEADSKLRHANKDLVKTLSAEVRADLTSYRINKALNDNIPTTATAIALGRDIVKYTGAGNDLQTKEHLAIGWSTIHPLIDADLIVDKRQPNFTNSDGSTKRANMFKAYQQTFQKKKAKGDRECYMFEVGKADEAQAFCDALSRESAIDPANPRSAIYGNPCVSWDSPYNAQLGPISSRMNKDARFQFKYRTVKPTYDAMNKLQDTPFYVNGKVLDRMLMDLDAIKTKIKDESDSKVSEDSKIKELELTVELAIEWRNSPIYSPVLLDFRGRTYYGSKYLTRSGSDWAKALLSVEPETIGYDGWDNLLIAAIDFRDRGVEAKMSRAEKLSLAETQIDDFIAVANGDDFLYAGEAGQFYAVCCDIAGAYDMDLRFDEYKSGVLLSRDASQSGPMLMGIATQDEMAMKYTNVLEDTKRYDLYEYVGSVMLRLLKESNYTQSPITKMPEEHWKQPNWYRQNEETFKAQAKKDFLQLFDAEPKAIRKWAKYPLMLFGYSAKEFCIASDLWDKMNLKYDWLTPVHCKLIADLFYKSCREAIPSVYSFMMGMKKFGTHARKEGTMEVPEMKDILVTSAYSGFPFMQDYKVSEQKSKEVYSKKARRHLSFKVYTDKLDRFAIDSGTAANVVHSIDADLLKMVVNKFPGTISTNHDAFFATAGRINELDKVLRECTYELSNLDLIGNILSKYSVSADELGITVNDRHTNFRPQNNEFCYS